MVRDTRGRRVLPGLALVLALSLAGMLNGGNARAQGATFACPAPTANASPEVGPHVASPVPPEAAFPEEGGDLTVFAAASLTDAFGEMKGDLEAAHPGLAITYNFAGSQALVTQLAAGAEADIFASANSAQMQAAIEDGTVSGQPEMFVRNQLAIVVPADNPAGITSAADLGNPDLRLVLAQPEVPVGRYARASICAMGAVASANGAGFVERVTENIVSEEEDVRGVLAKVQLGEADAGIVYVSDAAIAGEDVQLIPIPSEVNVIASYPIAAVTDGEALAEAFIAYVLSEDGQATLADYGFTPVS